MVARDDRLHSDGDYGATRLDPRTPSHHDRDRILYSAALRRMAGITQVLPAWEGHGFHNRLTHSLKVAQIGRRLSEYLDQNQRDAVTAAGGLSPDVVESAALAHDLGHPPFGHGAENTLDSLVKGHGNDGGFEGNPQSFRIVSRNIVYSTKYPGLNLTRATLNAILKYPWRRQPGHETRDKKWGAYPEDMDAFAFARELSGKHEEKSLEAAIMDWSDDVAYAVHDLDDFYRAGLIPLDRIVDPGRVRDMFLDHPATVKKRGEDRSTREEAVAFLDTLASDPMFFPDILKAPYDGSKEQQVALQRLASRLITRYVSTISGARGEAPAVYIGSGQKPLVVGKARRAEVNLLKQMAVVFVFDSPALLVRQRGQRKMVEELFHDFYAATGDSRETRLVPAPFHDEARYILGGRSKLGPKDEAGRRGRLVADAIASLGEDQVVAYHRGMRGGDSTPFGGAAIV